jgi:hypothetical protein
MFRQAQQIDVQILAVRVTVNFDRLVKTRCQSKHLDQSASMTKREVVDTALAGAPKCEQKDYAGLPDIAPSGLLSSQRGMKTPEDEVELPEAHFVHLASAIRR